MHADVRKVSISIRACDIGDRALLTGADYWDFASAEWQAVGCETLWRQHSDAVNIAFLSERLAKTKVSTILKTDMFDESSTAGLAPFLSQRARTVVGMDVSPGVLRAAGARHPWLAQTAADVRRLPFADGSFDGIVSNSTLDHFTNVDELYASLRELARVVRPGGRLIVMLDNPLNPLVGIRNALPFKFLNRIGLVPYFVGATIGARELRRQIEAAGLTVDEIAYTLHCPRFPAVLATRLMRRCRPETQQRLLSFLLRFERLARLPTRALTGYFVVVCASKAPS